MYIIMLIGVLLVWFRMDKNIRQSKIDFKYVYINYLILIMFILLFFPPFTSLLLFITKIKSTANMIFTIVIAYLFYASFINQLTSARQEKNIEKIAREVSLLKAELEELNNDL